MHANNEISGVLSEVGVLWTDGQGDVSLYVLVGVPQCTIGGTQCRQRGTI